MNFGSREEWEAPSLSGIAQQERHAWA